MSRRTLVAGVDSSTQSCKFIVVEASTGTLVSSAALPHPEGTALDPERWWDALEGVGGNRLDGVDAISITAQQHTAIVLDESGESVRDAILWNDPRAAHQALELRRELGTEKWIDEVGGLPTAAHPIAKLRWLAENEPHHARRIHRLLIPHDWLTWRLLGRTSEPTTDRSDASGTGYWSADDGEYRPALIKHAFGRGLDVPRVLQPAERAGVLSHGTVVGAGCGDNAAALLGLGTVRGEAVVSVGTSLTISMTTDHVVRDLTGHVSGMADASGGHQPIVATLNGARTFTSAARMLGLGVDELDSLAQTAASDAAGIAFLPYLDGERTPFLPEAQGALFGLTRSSMKPENVARAAVLALSCVIANAIDDFAANGIAASSITIVGGGARSISLRQAVADMTGIPVNWPGAHEYAAIGAARQAAWALTGELPHWSRPLYATATPSPDIGWVRAVRERHDLAGHRLQTQSTTGRQS